MSAKKNQFQARLENQKAQLERHGNFAEVVIRTTPEGTDIINFARLWEYVLVQADRQTRGYVAKSNREDFEQTRQDFEDSMSFMIEKMKESIARHNLDLTGNNFISRVAQRYSIVERSKKKEEKKPPKKEAAPKEEAVKKEKAKESEKKAPKPKIEEVEDL